MSQLKYSDFLQKVYDNCNPTNEFIFFCNIARVVAGIYDIDGVKHPEHLKRLLAHIKRLLNKQHKMKQALYSYDPPYSNTLTYYFNNSNEAKMQWLANQIKKQKARGN